MKNNDLINRYIYAVTKNLSSKTRRDVSAELHSIISDMLDERCGAIKPTDHDVRVVLTELGTPNELADKYNPDGSKCLIGSPYYSKYKFVLKIVLVCFAFGMTISGLISFILNPKILSYSAAWQWLNLIFSGLTFTFTFVTILFALFYRFGIDIRTPNDTIDNLPPVPRNNDNISKWESIFGISISVIFAVIFLAAPQIICAVFTANGSFVPLFNVETIKSTWYIIIAFAVLGIIRESVKLIEGRYTYRVMVVTIIANLISAGLSFFWLMDNNIMNQEFTAEIVKLFGENGAFIARFFINFQHFFLGMILFALIIDTATTVTRTIRGSK